MHLLYMLQVYITHSLAPVEHGRQLQQDIIGLLQQFIKE